MQAPTYHKVDAPRRRAWLVHQKPSPGVIVVAPVVLRLAAEHIIAVLDRGRRSGTLACRDLGMIITPDCPSRSVRSPSRVRSPDRNVVERRVTSVRGKRIDVDMDVFEVSNLTNE